MVGACVPAEQLQRLVSTSTPDLLDVLGLGEVRRGRALLNMLCRPAARYLAKQAATYDWLVGERGLQCGAEWLLRRFADELQVAGQANVPTRGPLLVVSNHPGLTDAVALIVGIARDDLHILAAERPFLRALPCTSAHLIYVPAGAGERAPIIRTAASRLRRGHAVLIFPAGCLEPDPLAQPGALESLGSWSRGISVLVRLAPNAQIVPAVVSGVRSPPTLRHPLTRLRRQPHDRERVSALLQIFVRLHHTVRVRVAFGPPLSARELMAAYPVASSLSDALVEQVRRLLLSPPTDWHLLVDVDRPADGPAIDVAAARPPGVCREGRRHQTAPGWHRSCGRVGRD